MLQRRNVALGSSASNSYDLRTIRRGDEAGILRRRGSCISRGRSPDTKSKPRPRPPAIPMPTTPDASRRTNVEKYRTQYFGDSSNHPALPSKPKLSGSTRGPYVVDGSTKSPSSSRPLSSIKRGDRSLPLVSDPLSNHDTYGIPEKDTKQKVQDWLAAAQ